MPEMTVEDLEREINNKYGAGTMIRGSDPTLEVVRIPSGILSLDYLLGGGFARGRHNEIYGGYNVGKTYTTYRLIANAQAQGIKCAFIDIEGTYDPVFAADAGVDVDELFFPKKRKHGNQAIDIMELLIRSDQFGVIVLDSIASLLPKDEMEKDMEAGSMGAEQAKMMSKALRKLTAAMNSADNPPTLVYINQTREAIGVMFGKRTTTSGGRAMGFYAGTRIEMVRTGNIKESGRFIDAEKGDTKKDVVTAHRVLVRVEKDKTGGTTPHAESTFVFDYKSHNIDPIEDVIYVGLHLGIVQKSGNNWMIEDEPASRQNGRKRFKSYLKKHPELVEEITDEIKEIIY